MKPAKIFVIGDTHFGHTNIIKFEGDFRPFATIQEHDEALVERWNSVVCPQDTVWHLGDVCFGMQNLWRVGKLNGHKKLVMGNHDRFDSNVYLKYFERLYGVGSVDRKINEKHVRCVLTHIPVNPAQFSRYEFNVHGHLHHNNYDDKRYINVSCEQSNLTPKTLDSWLEERL